MVCVDDDFKIEGKKGKNLGLDKVMEVVKEFILRIVILLIGECGEVIDFNDFYVVWGLEEVS